MSSAAASAPARCVAESAPAAPRRAGTSCMIDRIIMQITNLVETLLFCWLPVVGRAGEGKPIARRACPPGLCTMGTT